MQSVAVMSHHISPQVKDYVKQQRVSCRAVCERPLKVFTDGGVSKEMVFCNSYHDQATTVLGVRALEALGFSVKLLQGEYLTRIDVQKMCNITNHTCRPNPERNLPLSADKLS